MKADGDMKADGKGAVSGGQPGQRVSGRRCFEERAEDPPAPDT